MRKYAIFFEEINTITPGAPLTNFNNGGGSNRGSYFIPQKITTSEFVSTQKNHYFFLTHPKKSLSPFSATQIHPFVFSVTQKNPGVFHRPKKSLWAKISDPRKSLGPPPPSPSLKYVSGAPGTITWSLIIHDSFHLHLGSI